MYVCSEWRPAASSSAAAITFCMRKSSCPMSHTTQPDLPPPRLPPYRQSSQGPRDLQAQARGEPAAPVDQGGARGLEGKNNSCAPAVRAGGARLHRCPGWRRQLSFYQQNGGGLVDPVGLKGGWGGGVATVAGRRGTDDGHLLAAPASAFPRASREHIAGHIALFQGNSSARLHRINKDSHHH
jgi:hypothetical protein